MDHDETAELLAQDSAVRFGENALRWLRRLRMPAARPADIAFLAAAIRDRHKDVAHACPSRRRQPHHPRHFQQQQLKEEEEEQQQQRQQQRQLSKQQQQQQQQ
jgi:hypothetical protein